MKKLLFILVTLITLWYVMPFSTLLKDKYSTEMKCNEKNGEDKDDQGKDKTKEFIHDHQVVTLPSTTDQLLALYCTAQFPQLLIPTETPPPDFI